MRYIAAMLFLATFSGPAVASSTDGNELHQWQKADEDLSISPYKAGLYMGFIVGIVDLGNGSLFCAYPNVSREQSGAVVTKYLKAHPEQWNEPAAGIVVRAMREAFPCEK